MMFFNKKEKKSSSGVKTQVLSNPYFAASSEWLELYGTCVVRARQWRMAGLVMMVLCALSLGLNIFLSTRSTVVPYYVSVDDLGQAAVSRLDNPGTPQRALVQAELANVVTNWRSVTADIDLQKRMVDRLTQFIAGSARGVIQEWYAANNPYERAKSGHLVQVSVKGLPLPVSADSWRVEWTETTRNHSGSVVSTQSYQATLRVQFNPPSTDAQIMTNPGGIYIVEINHSTIMEPQR